MGLSNLLRTLRSILVPSVKTINTALNCLFVIFHRCDLELGRNMASKICLFDPVCVSRSENRNSLKSAATSRIFVVLFHSYT